MLARGAAEGGGVGLAPGSVLRGQFSVPDGSGGPPAFTSSSKNAQFWEEKFDPGAGTGVPAPPAPEAPKTPPPTPPPPWLPGPQGYASDLFTLTQMKRRKEGTGIKGQKASKGKR